MQETGDQGAWPACRRWGVRGRGLHAGDGGEGACPACRRLVASIGWAQHVGKGV